jgi:hypothetical protein
MTSTPPDPRPGPEQGDRREQAGPAPAERVTRPITTPPSPLDQPNRHRELLDEITEAVRRRLDEAAVADASARADLAARAPGVTGESGDGAVRVSVDRKGLIERVDFAAAASGMTPDELRAATFEALDEAKARLGGRRVSTSAVAALHDRTVPRTILHVAQGGTP